jgi:hypothetical protein
VNTALFLVSGVVSPALMGLVLYLVYRERGEDDEDAEASA